MSLSIGRQALEANEERNISRLLRLDTWNATKPKRIYRSLTDSTKLDWRLTN